MLVQSKGAREAGNTVGVGRQGCEQSRIGQCHNPNNNGWAANNHAAANNPCLSASRSAKLPRVEDQKRQTAGQVLERPPSPSPFLNERPSHTRACVLCLPLHPPLQCPIQPNPTYNATMRAIVYISTIVISSNGVLSTDATVALSISRQENRPYRGWSKSNSSTHKLEKYTSKRSRRCINLFSPSHILTPHSPVVICFSFLFFGDKRAVSVCL